MALSWSRASRILTAYSPVSRRQESHGGRWVGVHDVLERDLWTVLSTHKPRSAREAFWAQSVWLPRRARQGRRAGRVRRQPRREAAPLVGAVGPSGLAGPGALARSVASAAVSPEVSAPQGARAPVPAGPGPVALVIGPCASIADIEAVIDDLASAPHFRVVGRRFGQGSFRYSGYCDNPHNLLRWLSGRPSVGAAVATGEAIVVTPRGVGA